MSFSSHFSFFVLVDEVTKNENRLRDFLYDVFRLQGKTGKMKMKNNKEQTNYYVIFSFFRNFCQPKWKRKNGMKSSYVTLCTFQEIKSALFYKDLGTDSSAAI